MTIKKDGLVDNLNEASKTGRLKFAQVNNFLPENIETVNRHTLLGKCIHYPVDVALTGDIKIIGDDNIIDHEFSKHDIINKISIAIKSAIINGQAVIAIDVAKDGTKSTEKPLNLDKLIEVENIVVFEKKDINKVGEYITVNIKDGRQKKYHESRIFFINTGDSNQYDLNNSRLSYLLTAINQYQIALNHANAMLLRKQQPIYKMAGLAENIEQNPEVEKLVSTKLDVIKTNMGDFNIIATDIADEFNIIDVGLSGVIDVITENKLKIASLSYIPITHLFGESAKGLNSTGDGDHKVFLTYIESIRTHYCEPVVKWLVNILGSQSTIKSKLKDFDVDNFKIDWKAVIEPTDKEKAEVEKTKTETAQIKINMINSLVEWGIYTEEIAREKINELCLLGDSNGET